MGWATRIDDPWDWWRRRLAGEAVEMSPDMPHAGFYRMPHKERYGARKTFMPVAYWWTAGELQCRVGDEDVSPEHGQMIWTRVGQHPVSEESYREVAEDGGLWPDEHELVGMGHNKPPEDLSTFEGLRDSIENLAREAETRIIGPPITDQDEANQIANLADRLAELCALAEERKKEERKPHDEALKAIQLKWEPILTTAETYKDLKYKLLTPWAKQQKKAAQKAVEEAAAAGTAPPATEPRRPRAGTRGRTMTLKSTKRAKIVDYDICWTFFKDSEDMRSTVQMLANRAVRTGLTVPGTEVIEEEKMV
jgi:hypothetical protein